MAKIFSPLGKPETRALGQCDSWYKLSMAWTTWREPYTTAFSTIRYRSGLWHLSLLCNYAWPIEQIRQPIMKASTSSLSLAMTLAIQPAPNAFYAHGCFSFAALYFDVLSFRAEQWLGYPEFQYPYISSFWKSQLYFSERDNARPVSITCTTASHTHKSLHRRWILSETLFGRLSNSGPRNCQVGRVLN